MKQFIDNLDQKQNNKNDWIYKYILTMQQILNLKRSSSWSGQQTNEQLQQAQLPSIEQRKKMSVSLTRQLQQNNMTLKNQTYALINQILRNSVNINNNNKNTCKICQNNVDIDQAISIGNCQHKFCQGCLAQYCIYKININQDVLCPQDGCKQCLTQNSSLFQHLPQEMHDKFKEHLVWKQSLDNPNVKLCPSQSCKGGEVDLLKIPPQCRKCLAKYCKQCMMPYHEGACDQNFQKSFKQWKRCPKCKIFIQKNEGCNHMTCRCTHQFCFVCLSDWQSSHYECVQGFNGIYFSGTEDIPKNRAIIYLAILIAMFPLVLVVIGLILAIAVLIGFVCGVCLGMAAFFGCLKDCTLLGKLFCLVFLPVVVIIGAILTPPLCICCLTVPISRKVLKKYCNTYNFLIQQVKKPKTEKKENRRINSEEQIVDQVQLE